LIVLVIYQFNPHTENKHAVTLKSLVFAMKLLKTVQINRQQLSILALYYTKGVYFQLEAV